MEQEIFCVTDLSLSPKPKTTITMASASAAAAVGWYDKSPSDMSLKELKLAICNAGLRGESEGFLEKSEFVGLLTSYLPT